MGREDAETTEEGVPHSGVHRRVGWLAQVDAETTANPGQERKAPRYSGWAQHPDE